MGIVGVVLQLMLSSLGGFGPGQDETLFAAPELMPTPEKAMHRFVNYEIAAPPPDRGVPIAETVLLEHEFVASWGRPYTVPFTAPSHEFQHVELTLEVETFGIQYDRLAHVSLGDVEVWRPSTSEPRGRPSYSSFRKDVSTFAALFRSNSTLSFELNNLVTERLNGTFNVTLTAAYYAASSSSSVEGAVSEWFEHERKPATHIKPVLTSQVATEPVGAVLPQLSRNTTRAVLQIFASGNGNDEFWYAASSLDDDDDRTGPVRHLVVDIDGEPAGVVAPFQQIYTGGFQPALWSPFVALHAYDVPSYHIDVTPFLPDLWAGEARLAVAVKDTHHGLVSHEWIVSAALLTWESAGVSGAGTRYAATSNNHSASVLVPGTEITTFTSKVNVSADLEFAPHAPVRVEWLQDLSTDAVLNGELVVSHSTATNSIVTYNESTYSSYRHSELVLALNATSIAVAQGLSVTDVNAPEHLPPLDARKHSAKYNGSWDNFGLQGSHNGSEVTVSFFDPWHVGADSAQPYTYHAHAVSRNGSAVRLESGAHLAAADRAFAEISPVRKWFSSDMSTQALENNRKLRHAWLRHGL